jgi:hypothetical protein
MIDPTKDEIEESMRLDNEDAWREAGCPREAIRDSGTTVVTMRLCCSTPGRALPSRVLAADGAADSIAST